MSTIADYAGRTVDVLAWQWPPASDLRAQLTPALMQPGNSGTIITGIGKLIQRFLLELLTEQGSMIYQPTRGTLFMTYLREGLVRTSAEAEQMFYSALVDITRNLLSDQLDTDPTDEQFAGATLINVSLSQDTLTLGLYITSQAGVSRNVILPISTAIIGG